MGEVYRADDLVLRQTVALKFLPESLAGTPGRLQRFHAEVRMARQISHPNVRRVYDIGEARGRHFLSMEYVDGEDLASLIRRIGRLPTDKALEIGRQICVGLAAAHDKGVLHRDLKPHNVMIDSRGRARITDFGLARSIESLDSADLGAGTPAYMAPEQLAGRQVSVKSDLYSLGLVLFELLTGRRVFEGKAPDEVRRLHDMDTPPTVASYLPGIDPSLEHVILQCLQKDPDNRPASALAVAAVLGGSDPLAVAVSAGQTPSPEMIARSGDEGGLSPPAASLCLLSFLLGAVALSLLGPRISLYRQVGLEQPPQVLAARAREIISTLGHSEAPTDSDYGLRYASGYLNYVAKKDPSADRWARLSSGRPTAMIFWYRQGAEYLVPVLAANGGDGMISMHDPPFTRAHMIGVELDLDGRLLKLVAVPTQMEQPDQGQPAAEFDWSVLFAEAGLDPARFETTDPVWTPPFYADARAAWEGSYVEEPEMPVRVEACVHGGRCVYFRLIEPWTLETRKDPSAKGSGTKLGVVTFVVVWMTILFGALWLAVRNIRRGRADRRSAFRLAIYVFALKMLGWIFRASHCPDLEAELAIFYYALVMSLQSAFRYWLYYVALEPYMRRLWPHTLIAWTRVLAGRLRDPLVGRHVLVAGLFAVGWRLLTAAGYFIPAWLGSPPLPPSREMGLDSLLGARYLVAGLFDLQVRSIYYGLLFLTFFLMLRMVLRKTWLAAAVFVLMFTVTVISYGDPSVHWVCWIIFSASLILLLKRFGLFAAVVALFFSNVLSQAPISADVSAWYVGATAFSWAVVLALACYGFYTSLGGRPLLRDSLLET